MTDRSSNADLAASLARELFALGSEGPQRPCSRIQFMTGDWKTSEQGMGGMIESSLANYLRQCLDRLRPSHETEGKRRCECPPGHCEMESVPFYCRDTHGEKHDDNRADRNIGLPAVVGGNVVGVHAENPFRHAGYVMSEPHLSGYRLVVGFETLDAVDAAHSFVARKCGSAPETVAPQLCQHKAGKIRSGFERAYATAWCLECGGLTWCGDGWISPEEAKRNDYTEWLNQNLLAWSCKSETEGREKCSRWCGHHQYCTAALRDAKKTFPSQEK